LTTIPIFYNLCDIPHIVKEVFGNKHAHEKEEKKKQKMMYFLWSNVKTNTKKG
jgi:truncated hemoglobin YjbI